MMYTQFRAGAGTFSQYFNNLSPKISGKLLTLKDKCKKCIIKSVYVAIGFYAKVMYANIMN